MTYVEWTHGQVTHYVEYRGVEPQRWCSLTPWGSVIGSEGMYPLIPSGSKRRELSLETFEAYKEMCE